MLFRALSAAVYGIDANLVDVEVDLTPARSEVDQTPAVIIVGLPDLAVRELAFVVIMNDVVHYSSGNACIYKMRAKMIRAQKRRLDSSNQTRPPVRRPD